MISVGEPTFCGICNWLFSQESIIYHKKSYSSSTLADTFIIVLVEAHLERFNLFNQANWDYDASGVIVVSIGSNT